LLDDDQFLPGRARPMPTLTTRATLTTSLGNAEQLRDGIDRRLSNILTRTPEAAAGRPLF